MKTRMPVLVATAMAAILVAANAPPNRVTSHAHATPQQEGLRAGNSECAPSANPDHARYSCPQNRAAEPPPAPTF